MDLPPGKFQQVSIIRKLNLRTKENNIMTNKGIPDDENAYSIKELYSLFFKGYLLTIDDETSPSLHELIRNRYIKTPYKSSRSYDINKTMGY